MSINIDDIIGSCTEDQLRKLAATALNMLRNQDALEVIIEWARNNNEIDELRASAEAEA